MFNRLPETAKKAGVTLSASDHEKIMGKNIQNIINVDWTKYQGG